MSNMCLVVTPAIKNLTEEIRNLYPEPCERNKFNENMCSEWVGLYNDEHNLDPNKTPTAKSLVNHIEKLRNKEGKSFVRNLEEEKELANIEQEMQAIKEKAIADGTFMKAPNGKDTNLTERQWLQVRTKAFKRWFGDWENDPANASKVVDENEEPLVVYHVTENINNKQIPFSVFKTSFDFFRRERPIGAFFTTDLEYAKSLAKFKKQKNPYIYSAFLNIKNPFDTSSFDEGLSTRLSNRLLEDSFEEHYEYEDAGSDGIVGHDEYTHEHEKRGLIRSRGIEYVVENPNQVKSATDNIGTFSAENNSILATPAAEEYNEVPVEVQNEFADREESNRQREEYIRYIDSRESSDPQLNEKFGNKEEATVSEVLNNLLSFNTPYEGFVKALVDNIGEIGNIKVKLVNASHPLLSGNAGVFDASSNTILINRNSSFKDKGKAGRVDGSLIHEIVHAIVANSLKTEERRKELESLFNEAREKILNKYGVDSFDNLPEHLRKGRLYGLTNLDEFAAEFFTNSEFILELNDENTFGSRSDSKSLFHRLIEWIKSLLPKGVTKIYEKSGEVLEDIILNSGGTIQVDRNLLSSNNVVANTQSTKLSTSESPLQIYSDGSHFKGTEKIGYGSVFEIGGKQYGISGTEENEEVKKLQKLFPEAVFSNPSMEMLALATTLEYFANRGNGENIVINQDYKGAVNYQGLWEYSEGSVQRDPKAWKAKEPYIAALVNRSVAAIEKIKQDGGSVKINWVKGHQSAGTEQARMNDAADRYAKSRDNINTIDDAYVPKKAQQTPNTQNTKPNSTQQPAFDITQAEFYSGAAMGSDRAWANEAKKLGIKVTEFTVGSYEVLPQAEKDKYEAEYRDITRKLGYNEHPAGTYEGKLVRRNMMQADHADAVFAIGSLNSRNNVSGGTGYAVARGIQRGIPVYLYDRREKVWKVWREDKKQWYRTEMPTLTPHAAVIGTRGDIVGKDPRGYNIYDIKEEEKQVIRDILSKSVGNAASNERRKQDAASVRTQTSYDNNLSEKANKTIDTLRNWYNYATAHVTFDGKKHEYYLNGEKIDDSATQFAEKIFGKPNIKGDYSHSSAIGRSTDALYRDFFAHGVLKVKLTKYPNINSERKAKMLDDLQRLKKYLDNRFKTDKQGNPLYKVITTEFPIVASYNDASGKKTIAGTVDMLVIDNDGNIHIFDFKAKNHPITKTYEGEEVNDRRDYTAQLNIYRAIIESLNPALRGKVKTLQLVWADTAYPSIKAAVYKTDDNGNVTINTGDGAMSLEDSPAFTTPSLKPNVEESVIPLNVASQVDRLKIPQMEPIDTEEEEGEEGELDLPDEVFTSPAVKNLPATNNQPTQISQPATRPVSPSYESALKAPTSEQKEFYNAFSPEQIVDRARMITSMFSKIVNDTILDMRDFYQSIIDDSNAPKEDRENAKKSLETYKDPIIARMAAVNHKTYSGIMDEIKEDLEDQAEFATDDVTKQKLQNTIKYFDFLVNEASKWIEEEEGIRKGSDKTTEEEEQDDNDFGDNEEGNASNGNDGWSFKDKFNNPFRALSKQVRRVLCGIDSGKVDDLNNSKTYSSGYVYSALMSYLSKNIESADDFMLLTSETDYEDGAVDMEGVPVTVANYPHGYPRFPALEKMTEKYPWASQVIMRLTKDWRAKDEEDETQLKFPPTYGQLASQFYTNFRKAFIPYGKIQTGEGKYGVIPLNYDLEERSQYDALETSYNNGITYSDDSVYNADKTLNKENAKKIKKDIAKLVEPGKMATLYSEFKDSLEYGYGIEKEYQEQADEILNILKAFGINVTKDNVTALLLQTEEGKTLEGMLVDLREIAGQIENLDSNKNYIVDITDKYGKSIWTTFFRNRGFVSEINLIQSFYDPTTKKTLYSYSGDNYLQKTMRFLFSSNISLKQRRQYLDEHFGVYEWYRDQSYPKGEGWKSLWLEEAYNGNNLSDRPPYININNVDGVPYNQWGPSDKYRVMLRSWNTGSDTFAYYLSPIFADSPMSMTVRGPKYTRQQLIEGTYDHGTYIPSGFIRLIDQELNRIKYVREERAKAIAEGRIAEIPVYEKNGTKFRFMPELNAKIFGPANNLSFDEYVMDIREAYKGRPAGEVSKAIREAEIEALYRILGTKCAEFVANMPQDVKNEFTGLDNASNEEVFDLIEVPYYNMVYASSQIVALTTVDPAFFKNYTDFQKRFKQVYASGTRLNTNSRYGKKAERVILIADEKKTSRSYENIKRIVEASGNRLNAADRKHILDSFTFLKDRKLDGINVSDAQALRSLDSYRSILDMMGKWDERTELAYNRIKEGTWIREDFDIVLQTLKPFLYSIIAKPSGIDGQNIPIPIQHKNSELVLLAMHDLICGGLKNSARLRGINRFLEEVKDVNGLPIADMVQYESASKAANQGVIDINFSHNKLIKAVDEGKITVEYKKKGKKEATKTEVILPIKSKGNKRSDASDNFDSIKTYLTYQLINGKMSQELFNACMDYFEPTEDEVVEILTTYTTIKDGNGNLTIDTKSVHEIPFEDYMQAQPTPEHHMEAEAPQGSQGRNIIVADLPDSFKLTLEGKNSEKKTFGKEDLIDLYYNLHIENLLQNYAELREIFKDKESLMKKVKELAQTSPTYGREFSEAFSLDENGNFVLSPNSPTIFQKVQQLVNSVIKKHIAIQKVNGAALIQASGIGLSKELNLVYDENGKLVGAECYLPATHRRFFEAFTKKRTIKGQEVEILDEEALKEAGLDKALGFRIPTENKSSMLPIIIKGFSPQQNGSTVFLPAEITVLSGSDFDVDKLYVYLSSFFVSEYRMADARRDYAKTDSLFRSIVDSFVKAGNIQELEEDELEKIDEEAFKRWFAENKDRYKRPKPKIIKYEYDLSKEPEQNSRKARNNMLIQIMYGILTSQEGAEGLLNPQHFDDVKEASKMMKIMRDPDLFRAYKADNMITDDAAAIDDLLNAPISKLLDFLKKHDVERSPIYPQTFNYFHEQNMSGDALLSMFALQVSAAAKFQRASIVLKEAQRFTVNGYEVKDTDKIMNSHGEHRLKNVSQFVGACADNGKDPNVTDYGATNTNAQVIAYLLRAGLSIKEAALIINQPIMQMKMYQIRDIAGKPRTWKDSNITSETLAKAIVAPSTVTEEEEKSIAIMCLKVLDQARFLNNLTGVSRADSPNGGIQDTFAKARLYKYKVDFFNGKNYSYDSPFYPIREAVSNDKVNIKGTENEIRQQLRAEKMSMLQGFYSLGVQSFDYLLSPFFFMLGDKFDTMVVQKVLNQLPERMPDSQKEEVLTALYKDYISFALSELGLFGDENAESTMKQKRDYYINQFPTDFHKILITYPEIRNLIGNVLTTYNGRIVLKNGGHLLKGQKEEVIRRITSLRYISDPETQAVGENLLKDLFIYSYFDNGLQFTKDSFSVMFSTQVCTSIEGYNEALDNLEDTLTEKKANTFILQFYNMHPEIALPATKLLNSQYDDVSPSGVITIDRHHNTKFDNPFDSKIRPYSYISYGGELYMIDSWNNDLIKYRKIARYGDEITMLYNVNKSNAEMAEDYPFNPKPQLEEGSDNPFDDAGFMEMLAFSAEADPHFNNDNDSRVETNQKIETTTPEESSSQKAEDSSSTQYTDGENQIGTMC